MKKEFNEILNYLSQTVAITLNMLPDEIKDSANEIRLRAEKPLCLTVGGRTLFVNVNGSISDYPGDGSYTVSSEQIKESFVAACDHSVHSYINEIVDGYVTVSCGSRVGICGNVIFTDNKVTNIDNVYSLNYRISNQIIGVAEKLRQVLLNTEGLLICGPPSSGKTTILRDSIRLLSDSFLRVSVVDI